MIHTINFLITKIFNALLSPFDLIGDFAGIFFISAIVSVIVLIVYKYLSSAQMITHTTNQIKSNILAIRLYKDSAKIIILSFAKSIFFTFKYFILNLVPLIIIIPILFPLFVQMDIRYGMQSFQPGEDLILKAEFKSDVNRMDIQLLESDHYKTKMNPVYINAFHDEEQTKPMHEVNWKLQAIRRGKTRIQIEVNGQTFYKSLIIGEKDNILSNKKLGRSSWSHFIYPGERLIKENPNIKSICIKYPGKLVSLFGIKAHWIIFHLILVLILVLGFKKRFGVEFY